MRRHGGEFGNGRRAGRRLVWKNPTEKKIPMPMTGQPTPPNLPPPTEIRV